MTAYIFRLDNFRITNTRSLHRDTDYVSFTLKVGDTQFPTQTKKMGDLNNGTFNVDLEFGPITINDPNTPVVFNYQVVNAGHNSETEVQKALEAGAASLINAGGDILAASLGGGIWGVVVGAAAALATIGLGELVGLCFANCDGYVVVDQLAISGSTLADWVSNSGYYSEKRFYPGYDSPHGCGSNSRYYVTWSVEKA